WALVVKSGWGGPNIVLVSFLFDQCFFFSSRRRHTRFKCDWSSDVCSSDLWVRVHHRSGDGRGALDLRHVTPMTKSDLVVRMATRSEERRVGKESRSRWSLSQYKINVFLRVGQRDVYVDVSSKSSRRSHLSM